MAEELQSLLDRIQSEGVEKANAQAEAILADAKAKAAEIVVRAEAEAASLRAKAQEDAAVLQARSEQSIQQAARDVILSVQQAVQQTLDRVLLRKVQTLLDGDFLKAYLTAIAENMAREISGAEVRVAPSRADDLLAYAQEELSEAVAKGMKIAPDRDVSAGISVRVEGGRIEHDFTDKAVMEVLGSVLRPALAKLVFKA